MARIAENCVAIEWRHGTECNTCIIIYDTVILLVRKHATTLGIRFMRLATGLGLVTSVRA